MVKPQVLPLSAMHSVSGASGRKTVTVKTTYVAIIAKGELY